MHYCWVFIHVMFKLSITPATINPSIRKTEGKVVDNVPVAELSKPITAYCSRG